MSKYKLDRYRPALKIGDTSYKIYRMPSPYKAGMEKDDHGSWVKWEDVVKMLEELEEDLRNL